MDNKSLDQRLLHEKWEILRVNISKGKWKTNKINESVHSLTFVSNLAEEVNRIIEDVNAFKSSDNPEDIIAKKAFDPFDEATGNDDEEIQYLIKCIQK